MDWLDVLFWIFAAICALAMLALAGAMILIIVMTVAGFWSAYGPRKPRIEAGTPFGRFAKEGDGDWDYLGESVVSISVQDRDGAPDPAFVGQLPALLAELPLYERLAREAFDFQSAKDDLELHGEPFTLLFLSQTDEGFTLSFGAENDEEDLGMVFVDFQDGKVIDTTLVH